MVKLRFEKFLNPKLEEKLPGKGEFVRLFCSVRFKTKDGWDDAVDAIIDTGAPVSLIPFDVWSNAKTELLAEHEVYGINPSKECRIPVKVGKIKGVLVDEEENQSGEIEMLSYLALTTKIPVILGFKDLLTEFKICLDYSENEAFLEEKN